MCLASCGLTEPKRAAFAPIRASAASTPIEVTDALVDLANDLLPHAPRALRQQVFGLLGIEDTPNASIPYLSVAYFMGRKEEHVDAVRLLVGMSTLTQLG